MFALGLLYANGQGVTPDYGKARELCEKAAAQHDQFAEMALERKKETDEAVRLISAIVRYCGAGGVVVEHLSD
jgi:TPR repeat protein